MTQSTSESSDRFLTADGFLTDGFPTKLDLPQRASPVDMVVSLGVLTAAGLLAIVGLLLARG